MNLRKTIALQLQNLLIVWGYNMYLDLPLINVPSQEFVTQLDNHKYKFNLDLNTRGDQWALSISSENGDALILGVALLLGADFLSNNRFMKGTLYLVDYAGLGDDPTADTLDKFGLVWSDE